MYKNDKIIRRYSEPFKLKILLAVFTISLISGNIYGQCDDMIYEIDECISNSDDILRYLKKAYNKIDDAKSQAESAKYECE